MTTTTTLVHRVSNGSSQWWREGLIYEITSPLLGIADLQHLSTLFAHIASLKANAILLRPALVDPHSEHDSFQAFIASAHAHDLRVIVRISGALGPVTGLHARDDKRFIVGTEKSGEGLLERADSFLKMGADGIDLGTIIPPEVDAHTNLNKLTKYLTALHGLVATHASNGIVGADVSVRYPLALRHHLQEDWLHHLRDDSLMLSRWDTDNLTQNITTSLADHDRFGAPSVWRYLPSFRLTENTDPSNGSCWWNVPVAERHQRTLAMQALMLALPGCLYLRQGDEVALSDQDKPQLLADLCTVVNECSHVQTNQFGSPLANIRHAMHLRHKFSLAASSLAFVTGLDWCPPAEVLTVLTKGIIVLVNMGAQAISLPEHASVLLSSQRLGHFAGRLQVPPTATVWVDALTVK